MTGIHIYRLSCVQIKYTPSCISPYAGQLWRMVDNKICILFYAEGNPDCPQNLMGSKLDKDPASDF